MGFIISKSALELEQLSTGRTRQWLANGQSGTASTALIENYFEEGGFVPPHYHRTEELLVCLEGHGVVIMDDTFYDFPAGSVAVITPLNVHEVRNTGKAVMRMLGFFPEAEPKTIWVNNDEE
ncbi:cupin domain-containing protein [Pontibacter pamirensis]|uniref:cupin domain-containing protein n=1 Tax=Pontibacter pamirensis TaxID=2562824 RepID=UPI00138A01E7|nr:cupin domain-containing protein [Pontibacter pamirensis]